jgi:hypothetical protein
MKKVYSIVFVIIIMVSGMHFSVATHFCGGKVADVKYSFTGALASCGMENETKSLPINGEVSSNCCHNTINYLSVDNFKPYSFEFNGCYHQVIKLIAYPVSLVYNSLTLYFPFSFNTSPPLITAIHSRELATLCVFRI